VPGDRERWNERYRSDDGFDLPDRPMPALARRIDSLPTGRALDVATGTGRNARFLASEGYDVDAIDVADAALERAARVAADRGVDDRITWIRADVTDYAFERAAYDVITVSFFAALDRLPDLKAALAPGGVLCYEHHLRSSDPVDAGPSTDRVRFRSNDLLRACLDLTVLEYRERTRTDERGRTAAVATLVARKSTGGTQSYPPAPE
jgi:SAM-dependent methyltransferase